MRIERDQTETIKIKMNKDDKEYQQKRWNGVDGKMLDVRWMNLRFAYLMSLKHTMTLSSKSLPCPTNRAKQENVLH